MNEQRAKVSGMCDIPNSSYSARVSLKIIVFSMEMSCWSPEGIQHLYLFIYYNSQRFPISVNVHVKD